MMSYYASGLSKLKKTSMFPTGTIRMPSATPRNSSSYYYAVQLAFIITPFSFPLLMFSLLAAPFDKCVYGISCVNKRRHKMLTKKKVKRGE